MNVDPMLFADDANALRATFEAIARAEVEQACEELVQAGHLLRDQLPVVVDIVMQREATQNRLTAVALQLQGYLAASRSLLAMIERLRDQS